MYSKKIVEKQYWASTLITYAQMTRCSPMPYTHESRISFKKYWPASQKKSQSYQASIQCLAILMMFRWWTDDGPLLVLF